MRTACLVRMAWKLFVNKLSTDEAAFPCVLDYCGQLVREFASAAVYGPPTALRACQPERVPRFKKRSKRATSSAWGGGRGLRSTTLFGGATLNSLPRRDDKEGPSSECCERIADVAQYHFGAREERR